MSSVSTPEGLKTITIDRIVARVVDISTLPQVALSVLEVARNPDADAGDLKHVVEADPALSARVIRLVNSATHGVRSRVDNLQQAIGFIGFSQVRNLALTASVADIFKNDQKIGSYSRAGLWQHLVSVGIAARVVASRCGINEFEDAFLAGLLHDIGLIIADQHAHEHFCAVLVNLRPDTPLMDVEQRIMGFDHCQLGAAIAEAWRFPETTRAAIRHHHASFRCDDGAASIVRCVEIANAICAVKGVTSVGAKLIRPPLEAFQAVGFKKNDVIVLASDLDQEFERHRELFEI